jgi:tetratricopeptide (TPR) repeat protein
LGKGPTLVSILLAVAVFLCFSPSLRNGFVGYDDDEYVFDNPHVNTGISRQNAAWAFTAAHSSNWHPLTWISHQLDCTWYGLRPAGHHLTSLLLHVTNTVLLFLWLMSVTGMRVRSAFVALIFGLHPLHVESVAWVAERKDVLSTFFGILTLLSYSAYVRRPGFARYALVATLFAASLLSKPMLVTLPILLLLLDWWPLRRRFVLLDKLPLLGLSTLSAAVTIWAQRQAGSIAATDQLPLALRLPNAAASYVRYVMKTFWPTDLAVFYPLHPIPPWVWIASILALGVVTALAWAARRRCPWIAAGWGWYLLTLLPVIGIVQVGMQATADRYMYWPMIGILIALAWSIADVPLPAWIPTTAAACVIAACAVLSSKQIAVWKDGVTLFTHAVAVTGDNFVAHDNLGVELDRRGQAEEALAHYRETLRLKPGDRHGETNFAQASFAKGQRLFDAGKLDEALAVFREGLQYRPQSAFAHTQVGKILTQQHRLPEALGELRVALQIDPALADAHMGLGVALAWSGRAAEAGKSFENTLRYDPANAEAHYDLGMVRAAMGRNAEALASFEAVLRLKPTFGPAHVGRVETLYALGRYEEAWRALAPARAAHAEIDPRLTAWLDARFRR